ASCPEGLMRQTPPGRGSSVASVPIQSTILAGSVKYANTISGAAAIRISCSMRPSVSLGLAGISSTSLLLLGELLQALEPARQQLGEEPLQVLEALRSHAQHALGPFAALVEKLDVLEDLQVLRDRGLRDGEVRGDLAGRELATG